MPELIWGVVGLVLGVICGILFMRLKPIFGLKEAQKKVQKAVKDAKTQAEQIVRTAQLDAKTLTYEMKAEADKEIKEKKAEVASLENKLLQREQGIDKRDIALQGKEEILDQKNEQLSKRSKELDKREQDLDVKFEQIIKELEKVSAMTQQEAKEVLFERVKEKIAGEIASYIKTQEEEAKDKVNEKARNLLGLAVQKYSQEVACEKTISVVALPSDDLKGRIIGREGRNIRTLEQKIGVDLIIDDTPEVITVSCFDPIRRETARLALEYLIKDGRIQPGRIEEVVEKAKNDVQKSVHEAGINAAFKLGLPRINKELLDIIGRLKYRTSYGQNVLDHSIQVAYLTGIMASELGLDVNLAKRAGLLHDVGKAVDFEMEGSHVEIGVRLAKKHGEDEVVINSIESHHGDVEATSVIAHLVSAADTLSAARPGARSETLENYIKRIEDLEKICKSYDGVSSSYAMQSGREVRVLVVPEKISDNDAYKLARDIKEQIENEMTYPGQIKVSVVREVRATEIAK